MYHTIWSRSSYCYTQNACWLMPRWPTRSKPTWHTACSSPVFLALMSDIRLERSVGDSVSTPLETIVSQTGGYNVGFDAREPGRSNPKSVRQSKSRKGRYNVGFFKSTHF